MESRTNCPLCKELHNNCFLEQTELDGEPFESYMCFGCGMTTWNYAKIIDVPEDERDQYDGHDKRLDLENPQKFGQFEFIDACKAMGITVDLDG